MKKGITKLKDEKMKRKEDFELIAKIVKRGFRNMKNGYIEKSDMFMDLDATHENCALKLKELLEADDTNFYHDLFGIHNHLNRDTKMLNKYFLPRFAK